MSEYSDEQAKAQNTGPVEAEGYPVMAREDYLKIQLINSEARRLQGQFQLVAMQSAALQKEQQELVAQRQNLTMELNAKYGVDLMRSDVDGATLEIRPAQPKQVG